MGVQEIWEKKQNHARKNPQEIWKNGNREEVEFMEREIEKNGKEERKKMLGKVNGKK